MSDRHLRAALVALSAAGAVVAAYVLWTRWSDATLACSTGGCETVQRSAYAELAGVPVAALGLLGYAAIAAAALAAAPLARAVAAALALAGACFSAYLLVVQLAVIDAVCDWCLLNDALAALVAVAALLRLRSAAQAVSI